MHYKNTFRNCFKMFSCNSQRMLLFTCMLLLLEIKLSECDCMYTFNVKNSYYSQSQATLSCNNASEEDFKYTSWNFRHNLTTRYVKLKIEIINTPINTKYLTNEISKILESNKYDEHGFYNFDQLYLSISSNIGKEINFVNDIVNRYSNYIHILNLSNNKLSNVTMLRLSGEYISLKGNKFYHLKRFDVQSCNQFSELELDLSFCRINNINIDTFSDITKCLIKLHLDNNNLKTLNSSIKRLRRLDTLNLSNNKIENLDSDEFSETSLRILNLEGNNLKILSINFPPSITRINLGGNAHLSKVVNKVNLGNTIVDIDLFQNKIHVLDDIYLDGFSVIGKLNLNGNLINTINSDSFNSEIYPRISNLSISNSSIFLLSVNAFNNFSVDTLNLSHNEINVLKEYTFNNSKLKTLVLSNNKISYIDDAAFFGSDIKNVNLRNNNLKSINLSMFCATETNELNLSFNKLEYVNILNCKSYLLTQLDLSNNFIATLPSLSLTEVTFFDRLNFLNISHNKLSSLEFIEYYHQVAVLDLSHNKIISVKTSSFINFPNILALYLHDNMLTEINKFAFSNDQDLRVLTLTYHGAFNNQQFSKLSNLVNMTLRNSNVTLKSNCFNGLINLRKIIFDNVIVHGIENDTFQDLLSLKDADFKTILRSQNHLRNGIFRNLPAIETLNLTRGSLQILWYKAFEGLQNLKSLYLGHNSITNLKVGCFLGLDNLEQLYINNNGLYKIKTGVFTGLKNLKTLDISFNQLTIIYNHMLIPMKSLQFLSFEHNSLQYFDYVMFLQLWPQIRGVYVNGNDWKCDYLAKMLGNFTLQNIDYKPRVQGVNETYNIDEIQCLDICRYLYGC